MRTCNFGPVSSLLSLLFFGLFGSKAIAADGLADHSKGMQFTRPPLRFEINEGQSPAPVRFTVRERDGTTFLTNEGAVFQVVKRSDSDLRTLDRKKLPYSANDGSYEVSYTRMKPVGANSKARVTGLHRLPGVTNYFLGDDPKRWRTNVAGYAKVKYESVYPGIDLIYYGSSQGHLEYDFIVAPGANPDLIALSIEDAQKVEVDESGALVITAATGTIRKPAPNVYQEIDGKRREIVAGYRLIESTQARQATIAQQRVAFALGAYDRKHPLVIDPQIIYATYLGGSSNSTITNEGARGVAVDAQGAVYVVGVTQSADFLTKNPAQGTLHGFTNAFITKLDATGQLVYSTYLGGSGFDEGTVIRVDDTGAAYIGGVTSSIDFPTPNGALPRGGRNDGFITKLNPAGSQIVFSTYIGGTDNDSVADLALDAQKNVFIVGNVAPALGVPANDFPLVNPIQATHGGGFRDGFVAIISATGTTLLFSTYQGGDGDDFYQSIGVNSTSGDLYLGYFSDSSNFPTANPASNLLAGPSFAPAIPRIVAQTLDAGGLFAYLIGPWAIETLGDSPEKLARVFIGTAVALGVGKILVGPNPGGSLMPPSAAAPGGGLDIKLSLFDFDLNLSKTTSFGGSGEDTLNALTTDALGAVHVVGRTRSTNFPVINPVQGSHSGGNAFDGFLATFRPKTLQPLFATYLGGTGQESLNSVTVDPQGNIYVVGETFGNFPTTTPGALDTQFSGRTDAFVIKISPVTIPLPAAVDFDNDGKSDIGIYRDGTWVVIRSSDNGFTVDNLGGASHLPVPADYDGDGKHDIAVYLQSTGLWTIKRSSDGGITSVGHGGGTFIPVPGDYDGDGKADIAVYADGVWSIKRSSDGVIQVVAHGGPGWTPVPGDYDGDGKTDIAVYISGAWSILQSSNSTIRVVGHGGPSWEPVPADYDGDGKADVAAYTGGAWSIIRSSDNGNTVVGHGGPAWVPVPVDYDGDGKTDIAVYNAVGAWSIVKSANSSIQVIGHGGGPTDVPLN